MTKLYLTLLRPHGLQPTRLLCSWHFPGKNIGVGCHFLFRGISLLRDQTCRLCIARWILYHWATREALKGALKDIYILESTNLNMEGSFLKKLFLLPNMLNFFSLRRPFQITLARSMSALLSLNIMFRKDRERGSPCAYLSFSTQLVPWLWQVTQLTFLSLSSPYVRLKLSCLFFTAVVRVK